MHLDWIKLLSNHRTAKLNGTGTPDTDSTRSSFESDYDRIVYSAAFRRLAKKTQVHTRSPNDNIHTRLSHSLEVATVGRSFARRLGLFLKERCEAPESIGDSLAWILQSACIAHDIGNPPFGHAGEEAIREWVRNNPSHKGLETIKNTCQKTYLDWKIFEGNAQSFRICAPSTNPNAIGYIRMTDASLGAMAKYPWTSGDTRTAPKNKFGVFASEHQIFTESWNRMGLISTDGITLRHPLAYLSEAADDICYNIIDIEDGVAIELIDKDTAIRLFAGIAQTKIGDKKLEELRGLAIKSLIDNAWNSFTDNYDSIMSMSNTASLSLSHDTGIEPLLEEIEKTTSKRIFSDRTKLEYELGAYHVLGTILDLLLRAATQLGSCNDFSSAEIGYAEKKCLELAWGKDFIAKREKNDMLWWTCLARDYVAGMTDNFAHNFARVILGF